MTIPKRQELIAPGTRHQNTTPQNKKYSQKLHVLYSIPLHPCIVAVNTVDGPMEEIRRSPVEVGSVSHYLPIVFIHRKKVAFNSRIFDLSTRWWFQPLRKILVKMAIFPK